MRPQLRLSTAPQPAPARSLFSSLLFFLSAISLSLLFPHISQSFPLGILRSRQERLRRALRGLSWQGQACPGMLGLLAKPVQQLLSSADVLSVGLHAPPAGTRTCAFTQTTIYERVGWSGASSRRAPASAGARRGLTPRRWPNTRWASAL
jgi:hypothetical protein